MPFKDLAHFVRALEDSGELVRITEPVSPHLEIAEITDRISKTNGPALLFEQTGTDFPLLINAMGSEKRICMALGMETLDETGIRVKQLMDAFTTPKPGLIDKVKMLPLLQELSSWMPRSKKGRGACQEVVMKEPDLTKLPVLTCWPYDGGPFITFPCVHTMGYAHRASGSRNVGMYRMQVFGPTLTGMHWHLHKGSAAHFQEYKVAGKKMPVTVTLGGDPVYTYAATAPLPDDLDEYLLAGFLRKKRVELVRCLTNDLEVPSDVDFVIEGYIDPEEDLIFEGPFGDHTGFYSLADYFPKFHVTCITHRKNAIYPTTIVGIPPQEDGWIGKATERIFLTPMKLTVAPELTDIHMPVEGVFHNIVLASINPSYPGQANKVAGALWGAGQMMFNKILAVLPAGMDLNDYQEVARTVTKNVDPAENILFARGPVDILDHASRKYASGSKMALDATGYDNGKEFGTLTSGEKEKASVKNKYPDIQDVNTDLLSMGIGIVLFGIRDKKKNCIQEIASSMYEEKLFSDVPFWVFVDQEVAIGNLSMVTWIVANNLDPMRDCKVLQSENRSSVLVIDGTRKTAESDGFSRNWPNVVCMDDATISKINEKWPQLGLGPLIPSPSVKIKNLVVGSGAVAGTNNTI
jgi:4-hydroxy-3-polyprenylbenzoate decarboxylase